MELVAVVEAAALTPILILTLMMEGVVMAGEQIIAGTRECQPLQRCNSAKAEAEAAAAPEVQQEAQVEETQETQEAP